MNEIDFILNEDSNDNSDFELDDDLSNSADPSASLGPRAQSI